MSLFKLLCSHCLSIISHDHVINNFSQLKQIWKVLIINKENVEPWAKKKKIYLPIIAAKIHLTTNMFFSELLLFFQVIN